MVTFKIYEKLRSIYSFRLRERGTFKKMLIILQVELKNESCFQIEKVVM